MALPHPAAGAINHVLRSTPLALERLRRHAGRTAAFHVGPVDVVLTVRDTGEVQAANREAPRDLEVKLSPFLVPRLAAGDERAFHEVEMQGDVEFAQDVAFLARHLRWDYEEDLSKVVGDIAANRIGWAARGFRDWSRDAALRAGQGLAEYWTEETPVLASRVKVEGFVRDVDALRDDVERLEKRIERLEAADAPGGAKAP